MIDVTKQIPAPHVGEQVLLSRDALVEVARTSPGLPPTWRFLPAGTRGKLLGWRDRAREPAAIVEVDGTERRLVVYLGEAKLCRALTRVEPVRVPPLRHRSPSRRGPNR